jgi:hypothetical protein
MRDIYIERKKMTESISESILDEAILFPNLKNIHSQKITTSISPTYRLYYN